MWAAFSPLMLCAASLDQQTRLRSNPLKFSPFVATWNSAPVVTTRCSASAIKAVEVVRAMIKIAAILSLERDKVANLAIASGTPTGEHGAAC